MSERAMATLWRLKEKKPSRGKKAKTFELETPPIAVQFNPTSLRLQHRSNQDRGGVTGRSQHRHYPSVQPVVLGFDLEFDTAEEQLFTQTTGAATGGNVDVRERTAEIRRFVEPPRKKPSDPPPRVRFQWGTLIFNGIVTSITEDLDYFAADGTPLRARLSLSITEQNLAFEQNEFGPGAREDRGATEPGGAPVRDEPPDRATGARPGAAPGRSGTGDPQSQAPAVAGESVQQLAARIGGDPGAWRSLMNGLASPLAVPAGTPVEIGPELDAAGSLGRAAGFAAGAGVSAAEGLATVLGLATAAGGATGPAAAVGPDVTGVATAAEQAGFALSAAGGIAGAAGTALADLAGRAAAAARASFASPPPAGGDALDPRALSYGRALPLQARVDLATLAEIEAGGRRSLAARARPAEVPLAAAAGGAPWERLPPAASGRSASDRAQRRRDARPSTMRWRPGGECP